LPADPAVLPLPAGWENRLVDFLKTVPVGHPTGVSYRLAFVHRSYLNENPAGRVSNERLEFLGDSVLGLLAAEFLNLRHPGSDEGGLARRKAVLVSEPCLASWAREAGLGDLLLLGKGEKESGGNDKDALLADCFEAFLAALYLEEGLESARRWMAPFFLGAPAESQPSPLTDFKSRLQEWCQKKLKRPPTYRLIGMIGPEHSKTFLVEVQLADKPYGEGQGRSKKEAEQNAAATALRRIDQEISG
jgi:ribonuclease-3